MKPAWVIAASYASLALISLVAWNTAQISVGALSVLPLLFIAYHCRLSVALGTAILMGIGLALLDYDVFGSGARIQIPPAAGAVVLSAALCGAVLTAEALRRASMQNVLLREHLQRARDAAGRDPLTGIANRMRFLEALSEAIAVSSGAPIAVIFGDLDGFKAVNDSVGHSTGDLVLRLAAERLLHAVRAKDLVARIGGDEFAILIQHLSDGIHRPIETIEAEFRDPFHVQGRSFSVGITLGASFAPADGVIPEELLRIADERMYRAKQAKRGGDAALAEPMS